MTRPRHLSPGALQKTASRSGPKRGEIYLTALDPAVGHKIKKTTPALVVRSDTSNRYSAVILMAPIASSARLPISPVHVLQPADSHTGLTVSSVAVFNQIWAVDRKRLIKKIGAVDASLLAQADNAIKALFGLTLSRSDLDAESPPSITDAIARSTRDFKTGRYEG